MSSQTIVSKCQLVSGCEHEEPTGYAKKLRIEIVKTSRVQVPVQIKLALTRFSGKIGYLRDSVFLVVKQNEHTGHVAATNDSTDPRLNSHA